jgi:ribose transport system substrate-binding protein
MRFLSVLPRPLTAFCAAAVLSLTAAACGTSPAPPGQGAAAKGPPRVALVMKSLANEFFVTMAEGAKAHQAASGGAYTLIVNGIRNESDLSQQVALVEQMMAQGVDAIVIAPADSRALVPVLAKAQRQKIVVVNIDNKLDEPTLRQAGIDVPFVGPDNRAGARAVGLALAPRLGRGSKVAILEGIPTAFNAQQRRLGFEDAMRETGMTVVSVQSAHWEQDEANTIAAALLREHPDLAAILASNDNMALGAAAAVRQASRIGRVAVVGFDHIAAVQQLLKEGRIAATADQHGDKLAVFGIEYALGILKGETTPQDRQTPVDVIAAPK